jgi:hypothetical protein
MKKYLLSGVVLCLVCLGCDSRTHIPVYVPKPVEDTRQATCSVRDFVSAANLPSGSKNLGKVEIPRQEEEASTYVMMHQKVCELGGDAVSGVRWEVELGMPKPRALSGNAWKLP